MRFRFLLSAFLMFFFVAAPAHAATLEVSGWLPYWREASSTLSASAHLNQLTEINPFGYTVRGDGTLRDLFGANEEPWASFIQNAKAKKVRVVPTIMWSDSEAMYRILSNGTTRRALEDDIKTLVEGNNFDGIDIDFEGKSYETRDSFSTFLKGLAMRFPKKWLMCTVEARTPISSRYEDAPPEGAGQYANDYFAINKYCDRVRIMAYDQGSIDVKLNAAANQAPYVPVADPKWVEKAMLEALKYIPKRKLSIGVPTYGYEFEVTPLSDHGFRYDRLWALNQKYAYDLVTEYVTNVSRNSAGELSFSYIPKRPEMPDPAGIPPTIPQGAAITIGAINPATVGNTVQVVTQGTYNIVWWSDARAIQDKINLAKKLGLRGVSIFKIDGGEDQALWDLLPKVR